MSTSVHKRYADDDAFASLPFSELGGFLFRLIFGLFSIVGPHPMRLLHAVGKIFSGLMSSSSFSSASGFFEICGFCSFTLHYLFINIWPSFTFIFFFKRKMASISRLISTINV